MMSEKSDGCCFNQRNMKVAPLSETLNERLEIRPNRHLRVRHINTRPRDEAFIKEFKIYMDSIKSAAFTPRVVTVPRLNAKRSVELTREAITSRSDTNHNSTHLPNMTTAVIVNNKTDRLTVENVKSNTNETMPGKRPLSYNKDDSDMLSESRASVFSTGDKSVMSTSNVHVAMDKPVATPSVIVEAEEPLSSRSSHSIAMQNGLPSSKNSARRKSSQNSQMDKDSKLFQKPSISNQSPRNTNSTIISNAAIKNKQTTAKNITDRELVLFFIHGVGGSSDIWKAQMDYFEKLGCEVICLDLIGHGLSDAPDRKNAYTFEQILNDVQELFDKFCKRRNIVIGHSYGCAFATVLARERSKWMSKLVLVSGGGPTPLAPQPGVFSLPLCMLACCRPCLNHGFQRGAFHSNFKSSDERQKAFDVPSYVLSYVMNGQHWPDGDDLYHSWINVPTLLVYGIQDRLVGIEEENEMLKTIYGSHLEVVEDAGHMVMMETPDKFNQLLYNFITDQPLQTVNIDLDTHRTDVDEEYMQITHRTMAKSEVSLHSVRSCKSSKTMPHGLLSSSIK